MIDINNVREKCLDVFDKELIKFIEKEQMVVATFCLETCLYRKLHTLFTESELLSITEKIFKDLIIRDFVLDLTDKLSIELNLGLGNDFELEKYLAATIGYFDSIENIDKSNTLMPQPILVNICISKKDILETLRANKWMVTIILINLYFMSSNFFEQQPELDKNRTIRSIKNETKDK